MKLGPIAKPLPSVQLRLRLAGELNVELSAYASYYQATHHDQVSAAALVPEMLRAFMESDREFKEWLRKHGPATGTIAVMAAPRADGKEAVA